MNLYGDSIFESMETDMKNKNSAQQSLRNGDIESAKKAANNISDTAKKATVKAAINRQQKSEKSSDKE